MTDTNRAIDAVWRIESPRLIAGLARIVRDVGLAEDLAHDATARAEEDRGVVDRRKLGETCRKLERGRVCLVAENMVCGERAQSRRTGAGGARDGRSRREIP